MYFNRLKQNFDRPRRGHIGNARVPPKIAIRANGPAWI